MPCSAHNSPPCRVPGGGVQRVPRLQGRDWQPGSPGHSWQQRGPVSTGVKHLQASRTRPWSVCGRDKLQSRPQSRPSAPSARLPALASGPPPCPCQSLPCPHHVHSLSLPGCKVIGGARLESCGALHSFLIRQTNPSGETGEQLETGGLVDPHGHPKVPTIVPLL